METVEVYKGSVNSSQIRVGEVFKEAIRKNSSALIIIHNHPSGAPRSM
jgi:DNA repair protein RadC